ncbi:MAG: hypothetical protein AAGJ35_05885 [Myxococcota bacterium]
MSISKRILGIVGNVVIHVRRVAVYKVNVYFVQMRCTQDSIKRA